MKKYVDLVLVIPVGPGTSLDFLTDTIFSFIHYTSSSYRIIVIDDSGEGLGARVRESIPDVEVLFNKKSMGGWAGLYISLANAYAHALEKYEFKLLMKLDTDALVIGPEPEKEALDLFASDPSVGIAGQYQFDYDGNPWDLGWPRARILNGATTWRFIRRPLPNAVLRKLYIRALEHGYVAGESVFGGACVYSHALLQSLKEHRLLPNQTLGGLNLGEDHIFSLLAKSVGFSLGNLSRPGLPFALAWKGMPAAPEQLFAEGRKVIHSTRVWQDMDESRIRAFFREKREARKEAVPQNIAID